MASTLCTCKFESFSNTKTVQLIFVFGAKMTTGKYSLRNSLFFLMQMT